MYSRRRWHGTSRPRLIHIYIYVCMYAFSSFSWKTCSEEMKNDPENHLQMVLISSEMALKIPHWTSEVWLKEDPVRSGDWKHYLDVMQQFVSNLRQKANLRQPQHKDFSIYLRVNWWNLLQQFLWTSAHNKHPSRRYCCIALARLLKLQPIAP